MSEKIRVVVVGAAGKMGIEVVRAVSAASDMELVGAVDRPDEPTRTIHLCGKDVTDLPIDSKLGEVLDRTIPHVMVDFTQAASAPEHAISALKRKVSPIIGTSGLGSSDVATLRQATRELQTPAALIPNFAIGAVLMMRFAEMAAQWMPHVEIIDYHHAGKIDSPSGTALHTAERVAKARGEVTQMARSTQNDKHPGARGAKVKDLHLHSVRLPGLVAHQDVIFGGNGELLTIRHDSLDRKSFMDGVLLAVRKIRNQEGLIIGLDELMFE